LKFNKIVFLAQQELALPSVFNFNEHNYGPYSSDLANTLDNLVFTGDIDEAVYEDGDNIIYKYRVSLNAEPPKTCIIPIETMRTLKKLVKVPKNDIIDYICRKYMQNTLK
jgi:uncharacterized protein